jgi:peptidoglycan hydrolase CwlO-like protein
MALMANDNQPEQWHMKREINLAHVIVTVSMVITMMWFFADLDKRIDSNTKDIVHLQEQRTEDVERLDKQLDKINSKLDKLLVR